MSSATRQVVIYTRNGCGLCEQAAEVVRQSGLNPEMVDIDSDPRLRDRYNLHVPVIEIDGRERFRGRVNAVLLRRLLVAPGDQSADEASL